MIHFNPEFNRKFTNSLVFQMVFFVCGGIFVFLLMHTYYDNLMEEREIIKSKKRGLEVGADIITTQIEQAMLSGRKENIQAFVDTFRREEIFQNVQVLDSDKKIKASYFPDEWGQTLRETNAPNPYVFDQTKPLYLRPECIRCHGNKKEILGYVRIVRSMEKTFSDMKQFRTRHLLKEGLAVCLLAAGIGFFLMRLIRRPVQKILAAMHAVEAGDLSARARIQSRNEIGEIAKGLNRMVEFLREERNKLARLQAEKMSHMDRLASIGELTASLSHEIRNPLAGVLGSVQVLKERTPQDHPHYAIYEEILLQLNRMNKTTGDLLAYARPADFEPIPTRLNDLLDHAVLLVRKQSEMQKVSIEKIFSEIPPMLLDPTQMEQVFVNLLLNALQSMPNGGTLIMSSSLQGSMARVEVADTGTGIPPELLPKIFKPFFTTKSRGTGLGLSICLRIVEMHKGKISAESNAGKGSRFIVEIPLTASNG